MVTFLTTATTILSGPLGGIPATFKGECTHLTVAVSTLRGDPTSQT